MIVIEETRLWRAVLQQAYDDAELAESLELDWEPELRVQARAFLRADTPDDAALLKRVCDLADVPADRVYLWARRRYALGADGRDSCLVSGAPRPLLSLPDTSRDCHPDPRHSSCGHAAEPARLGEGSAFQLTEPGVDGSPPPPDQNNPHSQESGYNIDGAQHPDRIGTGTAPLGTNNDPVISAIAEPIGIQSPFTNHQSLSFTSHG